MSNKLDKSESNVILTDELIIQIVELKKDKERLDFLLQNVQQFYYPTCNPDNGYELKNRDDIDQAMSSK